MKRKPTASFLSLRTVVTAQNRRRCGNVLSSAYISLNSEMPVNLYNLLKASLSDSNSPNILLTVSLADLHQLMVDTIDATRERLLPLLKEGFRRSPSFQKEEVAKQLRIGLTSVYQSDQERQAYMPSRSTVPPATVKVRCRQLWTLKNPADEKGNIISKDSLKAKGQ